LTIGSKIEVCFVLWHKGRALVKDSHQLLEQGRQQLAKLAENTLDPVVRKVLTDTLATLDWTSAEREQANKDHMGLDLLALEGDFEKKLLQILIVWHSISSEQAASLKEQQSKQPELSMPQLLRAAGHLTAKQFETICHGVAFINSGNIDFRQFAVAYRDELDGMMTFDESLKLRGWLPEQVGMPASS
jgi:hypothetical protein